MPTRVFEAHARHAAGGPVIDLHGDIDRESEAALSASYEAAQPGASAIALNFAGVRYINSTGIAVIVGILARARRDGHELVAYGLSEHYREIFEITRLSSFVRIFPDERSALDARAGEHGF